MISVEAALTCSADTVRFFSRVAATSGHQRPPGKVVCPSEQAALPLLDGQNGFLGEEKFFDSSDLQVVIQVSLHFFEG